MKSRTDKCPGGQDVREGRKITFSSSIQGKLIGVYLTLTLTALAIVAALFSRSSEEILSKSVRDHLQTIALTKTNLISSWMAEREHDVEVLARNVTLSRYIALLTAKKVDRGSNEHQRELTTLLKLVRDQYEGYNEITAIDRNGVVLVSTSESPVPYLDELLLSQIRQGMRHTSDLRIHNGLGVLSLNIAVPVETDGVVNGAIIANIDLGVVNRMTDSTRLMESGEAYLVDRKGVFVTHRERARIFNENISHVEGVERVTRGRSGVGEYVDYRGILVLGAYQWLPRWNWGLMVEVDHAEAFASVSTMKRNLIWVVVFVALAALLATILVARRIVRPLRKLTYAVQAVASGRFDQRLVTPGSDEVAHLSECFNRMTTNLAEVHSTLEERVAEATQNLEEKNRRLELTNTELTGANTELEEQRAMVAHSARLAALGEMAAGFAHEINNPLTTIRNLLDLLRESPEDTRQQDVDIMAEETEKVTRLVTNFLSYTKPPESIVAPVNVVGIIERALDLVRPQLRERSIQIKTAFDPTVPAIQANGGQIEQVVMNLLLNAIQASPVEGVIKVFVHSYSTNGAPGRLELGVTDHGSGITTSNHNNVFKPFFTTKERGFGLGLAISQRIVNEHGGTISFTSTPGQQTTFVVTFPLQREVSV